MTSNNKIQKVSTLSRILAWILVFFGVFAILGLAADIYRHKGWPWNLGETILTAFFLLIYLLLSFYVAFKGRSPRWLASVETMYDREVGRRGVRITTTKPFRSLISTVASVVFGLFLIYFGNQIGLFAGANRWFAMIVLALAWLIITTLMWRYFRSSPAGGGDGLGRKTESKDQRVQHEKANH